MIKVSNISYKVIVITEKNIQLNITNAVSSLGWEENENELSMKISYEVYNTKYNGQLLSSLMKIGCLTAIKAEYGGKNSIVAYGKIVEAERVTNNGHVTYKVTAYDCLYDLQKSKDNVYFASGKKTESILRSLMGSWSVKIASYKGPNVKHSKIIFKNKALADIIREILDEAKKKGGGKGLIRSNQGKVDILKVGTNSDVYVFTNANSVSSSYKISTANMITRVKINATSKDGEKAKVEAIVNGKTSYGIRQDIITRSKSDSLKDAKKEAAQILKDKGEPKCTRKFEAPDVPCIRKGDKVNLDVTSISGEYIVTSIQHNADKGKMTVTVGKE